MNKEKDISTQTIKEVKWWAWAARVLPSIALVVVVVCEFMGLTDYKIPIIGVITILMSVIAIVWWWWAIYKIAWLATLFGKIKSNLSATSEEIKILKKNIKE